MTDALGEAAPSWTPVPGSDTPSLVPTSFAPSASPSSIRGLNPPSDVPSLVPSSAPTSIEFAGSGTGGVSDVPSLAPSDFPSMMPSAAPSSNLEVQGGTSAPSIRLGTPHACVEEIGQTVDGTTYMLILTYTYSLEVVANADPDVVAGESEEILQEMLGPRILTCLAGDDPDIAAAQIVAVDSRPLDTKVTDGEFWRLPTAYYCDC